MEPLRHNALKLIGNDRHADERRKTQNMCLNIFNIWDSVECCAYDEIWDEIVISTFYSSSVLLQLHVIKRQARLFKVWLCPISF